MNALELGVRSLARRPWRSAVTVVAIAVAAATYLLLVSMGRALVDQMQAAYDALASELVVQQAGAGFPTTSWLDRSQIHAVETVPHVRRAIGFVLTVTRLGEDDTFLVYGVGPSIPELPGLRVVAGRMFRPDAGEAMLGERTARMLGRAVGDTFVWRGRTFEVVGVYTSGRPLLDRGAVLPIGAMRDAMRLGERANLVFLQLDNPAHADRVRAEITRRDIGVEVMPADRLAAQVEQLDATGAAARHLALVALLAAALAVSNVLTVAVAERSGELAVLRAVGWRRRRIAAATAAEGVVAAAAGALAGIPVAGLVLAVLPLVDRVGVAPRTLAAATIVEMTVVVVAAGAVGSLPAIVRAVRIAPATALRSA